MPKYPISKEGIRQFLELKKKLLGSGQDIGMLTGHLTHVVELNYEQAGYLTDEIKQYIQDIRKYASHYEQSMSSMLQRIDIRIGQIEKFLNSASDSGSDSSTVSSVTSGNASHHAAQVSSGAASGWNRSPQETVSKHFSPSAAAAVPQSNNDHKGDAPDEKSALHFSDLKINEMLSRTGITDPEDLSLSYAHTMNYGYLANQQFAGNGTRISDDKEFLESLSLDIRECVERGNAGFINGLLESVAAENPSLRQAIATHTVYENLTAILFTSMITGERHDELASNLPNCTAWFEQKLTGNDITEQKTLSKRR